MFGGKGSPSLFYYFQVPRTNVPVVYELVVHPAVCTGVVWLTHCQEVWCEVPSDHLSGVYKNVSSKKSKGKHTYKEI